MEKILVLGSNSFSGASFTKYALEKGASVVGVSRSDENTKALAPYKWVNQKSFFFHHLN
jgi:dTDP-glucose 4,6-dehydratase